MLIKRRNFLKLSTLATASLFVPKFLRAFGEEENFLAPVGNRVLVVLQFNGGNDGLNTVVPICNDIYYKSRPTIGLSANKVLRLRDDVGLHPELKVFQRLYDEGNLAIMNNVGYPDPDRSHFRSSDIWQTASNSNEIIQSGWIGRYLDITQDNPKRPISAIEIGESLGRTLRGETQMGIAINDPQQLYNNSTSPFLDSLLASRRKLQHDLEHENLVEYLYKTVASTQSSAAYICEKSKLVNYAPGYPSTPLGNGLKTMASLILADMDTRIYYVSIAGFDTHFNQVESQNQVFKQVNDAVEAFTNELKCNNRFEDVLLCTFSEFGRRVVQNGSEGTDHGTANNMFFISGGLKEKGLLNALPDLSDLDNGDLKYKVDFKSVYATLLKNWLHVDDEKILGKRMEHLTFV